MGAVNGWVDYKERLEDVDFREDAFREMREEYAIERNEINGLIFCGLSPALQQSDMDFVYLAPHKLTDKEFLEKYKGRQDKEHSNLVKITNYQNMQQLL